MVRVKVRARSGLGFELGFWLEFSDLVLWIGLGLGLTFGFGMAFMLWL